MSRRELNPSTSSATNSQALETAKELGTCSDGKKCGVPPSVGDDAYCVDCPNKHKDGMPAHSKYHREIKPGVFVDVYSVLVAFGVTNPADAHAIKKMLMPGGRGAKGAIQDREEAIASIHRAIEIEMEGLS